MLHSDEGQACVLSPLLFIVHINWTASHNRVDEVVTVENCRINCLLFADDLVPLASVWKGASTYTFCCVRASRNENTPEKGPDTVYLQNTKPVYATSERQYSSASGKVQVPCGGTHKWRKAEQGNDTQIGKARAVVCELYCSVATKRELSNITELSVFQSVFVPILTYSHKYWLMTNRKYTRQRWDFCEEFTVWRFATKWAVMKFAEPWMYMHFTSELRDEKTFGGTELEDGVK